MPPPPLLLLPLLLLLLLLVSCSNTFPDPAPAQLITWSASTVAPLAVCRTCKAGARGASRRQPAPAAGSAARKPPTPTAQPVDRGRERLARTARRPRGLGAPKLGEVVSAGPAPGDAARVRPRGRSGWPHRRVPGRSGMTDAQPSGVCT